jgi:N-carbamoyl-L-amino-acid hydrolase
MPITSGAGHDAQEMAMLGPAGMIFVPSHEGRSHCPEEHSDLSDLVTGVRALAETLVAFDRAQ